MISWFPPVFRMANLHPAKFTWNPNMEVWKMIFRISIGWFLGSMFIFRGVNAAAHWTGTTGNEEFDCCCAAGMAKTEALMPPSIHDDGLASTPPNSNGWNLKMMVPKSGISFRSWFSGSMLNFTVYCSLSVFNPIQELLLGFAVRRAMHLGTSSHGVGFAMFAIRILHPQGNAWKTKMIAFFAWWHPGWTKSLGSWVILSEKGENEIPFHSADALTGFQMMDEFKILVTIWQNPPKTKTCTPTIMVQCNITWGSWNAFSMVRRPHPTEWLQPIYKHDRQ